MAQLTRRLDKTENDVSRLESQAGFSSTSSGETSLPMAPVSLVGASAHGDALGASASSSVVAPSPPELKGTEDKMKVFEGIVTILDRELEKYSEQVGCI